MNYDLCVMTHDTDLYLPGSTLSDSTLSDSTLSDSTLPNSTLPDSPLSDSTLSILDITNFNQIQTQLSFELSTVEFWLIVLYYTALRCTVLHCIPYPPNVPRPDRAKRSASRKFGRNYIWGGNINNQGLAKMLRAGYSQPLHRIKMPQMTHSIPIPNKNYPC